MVIKNEIAKKLIIGLLILSCLTATISPKCTGAVNINDYSNYTIGIDAYLSGDEAASFKAKIVDLIMGLLITEIFTRLLTEAEKYLNDFVDELSVGKIIQGEKVIRISLKGYTFNPSLKKNWLGDNYDLYGNPKTLCKAVQKYMTNDLHISCGTIDGMWGPKTKAGVIKMQKSLAVTADGICGEKTYLAIAGE